MRHPLDNVGDQTRREAIEQVDARLARQLLPGAVLQPVGAGLVVAAASPTYPDLGVVVWGYLWAVCFLAGGRSLLAAAAPKIYPRYPAAWKYGIHALTVALMVAWSITGMIVISAAGLDRVGVLAVLITGAIVAALNTVFVARRWMAWSSMAIAISGPAVGLFLVGDFLVLTAVLLYGLFFVGQSLTLYREYWDHTLATVRMSRSVNELERVNRELQLRSEQAVTAAASKTQFIANTSHELRTPLHGILGNAELLLARSADERATKLARAILDAGRSLLHLVNDVLELSRVESGQMRIEIDAEEPRKIVNAVHETVSRLAEPKGLDVEVLIDKPVPGLLLMDGERYKQILMNIAGNAVKFTRYGKVRIAVGYHAELDPPRLETYVSDTGPGIPVGKEGTIFEDFVQLDSGMDRRHEGSGLGLAICKRLVESMGGEIGLESVPNAGSTFWFSIPVRPTSSVEHQARSSGRIIAARDRHGRGSRILVVDDNASNRQLAVEQIEHLGHAADAADGAREAFALLDQFTYDLMLLDCQMPEVDGYEVARRVREMRGNTNHLVPIVAVTANAMPEERNRCLQAGMDDYMSKPLTLKMLGRTVDVWIGGSGGDTPSHEQQSPRAVTAPDEGWNASLESSNLQEYRLLIDAVGSGAIDDILAGFLDEFEAGLVSLVDAADDQAADRVSVACAHLAALCRDVGLANQARLLEAHGQAAALGDLDEVPHAPTVRSAVSNQISAARLALKNNVSLDASENVP